MALTRREQTSEEGVIQSSNFGGLNTTASPVNMPFGDAAALVNVDTDVSGKLTKRRGTRLITDSQGPGFASYPFGVLTNSGVPLVVSVYSTPAINGITVDAINNDISTNVGSFGFVFRDTKTVPKFVTLPGDVLRVLILGADHPPVQVAIHEYTATAAAAGTLFTMGRNKPFVGQGLITISPTSNTKVFVNGVISTNASIAEVGGALNVTLPASVPAGTLISVVYIRWNWWAEAETWWGDRFTHEIPRFGATPQDAVVQIPQSIVSDLPETDAVPYGIFAYGRSNTSGNWLDGRDTYVAPGTGVTAENSYVFSEGVVSEGAPLNPSPYFITYGRRSDDYERDISDGDIDITNGVIFVVNHEYEVGDTVSINYPSGTLTKFVFSITRDSVTLSNTFPAYTAPGLFQAFAANTIVAVDNVSEQLTIGSSVGIAQAVRVTYITNSGTPIVGLSSGSDYFVNVITPSEITLFFDAALQLPVNIINNAPGVHRLRRNAGLKLTTVPRRRTIFLRARPNKFRDGQGQTPANMSVTVDGTLVNFSASATAMGTWFNFSDNATRVSPSTTVGRYYSVPVTPGAPNTVGVSPLARVRVLNTQNLWLGSAANGDVLTGDGRAIPAYGLGYYADYLNGHFPSSGVVYQGRLLLSGFRNKPNTVLFSAVDDLLVTGESYNYFQITDDLELTTADPFDVQLSDDDNGRIVALAEWQNFLFAFTSNATYRISGENGVITPISRAVALAASKGAVSPTAIASTEDNIFFLSETGVYALPLTVSGDYRAQEVSIKIKDAFLAQVRNYNRSWMVYNPFDFKLYVGLHTKDPLALHSDKLYVYDTRQQSWTEYYAHAGFNIFGAAAYYDRTLGSNLGFGFTSSCNSGFARFNFRYPMDYAKYLPPNFSSGSIDLRPKSLPPLTSQQRLYTLDLLMTPVLDEFDVAVYINGVELTPVVQYRKASVNSIELVFAPVDGATMTYRPEPSGSYYGVGMVRNGRGQRLNRESLTLAAASVPPCNRYEVLYQVSVVGVDDEFPLELDSGRQVLTGDGASDGWLGWVYPAYYKTYAITNEMLYRFKRLENLSVWMTQKSVLINDISEVSIAVQYNDGDRGQLQTRLFDTGYVDPNAEYVLFRESLQSLGYAHQVLVWSHDMFTWVLDGWQIQATLMEGTGHISGDK